MCVCVGGCWSHPTELKDYSWLCVQGFTPGSARRTILESTMCMESAFTSVLSLTQSREGSAGRAQRSWLQCCILTTPWKTGYRALGSWRITRMPLCSPITVGGCHTARCSPAFEIHSMYPLSSRSICCCRRSLRKALRFSTLSLSLANSLWR